MEKQIETLQRKLKRAQAQGYHAEDEEDIESPMASGMYPSAMNNSSFMNNNDEAVSSLLHLKQSGGSYHRPIITHQLENIKLTEGDVNRLFNEFWTYFHPFLPFLNPQQAPDAYFKQAPLLFWSIISVAARRTNIDGLLKDLAAPLSRLLWTTIGGVPSNYHCIEALCLLCTWPLPVSTTSTDPTHILSGALMKAATGIGLHRPSHAQDFSRVSIDLNKDELHDRVTTWAVTNIVCQMIGTGYGQPATTLYDWTLATRPGDAGPFQLSAELEARLRIEQLADKISKEMYSNSKDPRGVSGDEHRMILTRVFLRDYEQLQSSILSDLNLSPLVNVHLKAVGLHLRLAALFDSRLSTGYVNELVGLWHATTAFLDLVFALENPQNGQPGNFLKYSTNYMHQMIDAAGFSLLKLMSSFFADDVDFNRGRELFHRTIKAIRTTSVMENDLQWRLAELMAQMWNGMSVEARQTPRRGESDPNLELKVRCRHSMSLVYDTIWRWREEYQARGRGSIDGMFCDAMDMQSDANLVTAAIKNPTNPDSAEESRSSSTPLDNTLVPPSHSMHQHPGMMSHTAPTLTGPGAMLGGYAESNYEVFDPLNWMLDGLVDFPYSYAAVQGLEAQGMIG